MIRRLAWIDAPLAVVAVPTGSIVDLTIVTPTEGLTAEKINAALSVCRAVKAMRGSGGIKVTVADANILVSLNANFEEFTICENGTPATRWIATFTARP